MQPSSSVSLWDRSTDSADSSKESNEMILLTRQALWAFLVSCVISESFMHGYGLEPRRSTAYGNSFPPISIHLKEN
jgi:hypothetical protein